MTQAIISVRLLNRRVDLLCYIRKSLNRQSPSWFLLC